jgi:hypothetical protein
MNSSAKFAVTLSVLVAIFGLGFGLFQMRRADAMQAELSKRPVHASKNSVQQHPVPSRTQEPQEIVSDQKKNPPSQPPLPLKKERLDPATNAEARKLYLMKRDAELDMNLRSLFDSLGLSEKQWHTYKELVGKSAELALEVRRRAAEENLSKAGQDEMMRSETEKLRSELGAALGNDAYQKLIQYNREQPLRNVVTDFAGKLLYSADPLTADQADQYIAILSQSQRSNLRHGNAYILGEQVMGFMRQTLTPKQFAVLEGQQRALKADLAGVELAERLGLDPPRP